MRWRNRLAVYHRMKIEKQLQKQKARELGVDDDEEDELAVVKSTHIANDLSTETLAFNKNSKDKKLFPNKSPQIVSNASEENGSGTTLLKNLKSDEIHSNISAIQIQTYLTTESSNISKNGSGINTESNIFQSSETQLKSLPFPILTFGIISLVCFSFYCFDFLG